MDERTFNAELCQKLKVSKPPCLVIQERKYGELLGTKTHLALEADPRSVVCDSSQWKLPVSELGEIRCPNCGAAHDNPHLILCYRVCHNCKYVLSEPHEIEIRNEQRKQLHILAATYGHPVQASLAVDVTKKLCSLVKSSQHQHLCILTSDNLGLLFGSDPCPRHRKVLKIRYVLHGRRGEVAASESNRPFHLQKDIRILASKTTPLMTILRATWGHPRGVIKGRGAFDVKDALQYRLDSTNGRYCAISHLEDLTDIFGEPCQGRAKHLVIEYEIMGKAGELYEYEINGRLAKDINLKAGPMMSPQIIIEEATYGWTESLLAERQKVLHKQLFQVQMLQDRRSMGLALSAAESKQLRQMATIQGAVDELKSVCLGHSDVTALVQRRIELAGGHILYLGGANGVLPDWAFAELVEKRANGIKLDSPDDLNELFGNPLPGQTKLLKIDYMLVGHDADRRTESTETTSSGFESNFIRQSRGSLTVVVEDDLDGRGIAQDTILLGSTTSVPSIEVCYASYGHAADPNQVWDVTAQVKVIVNKYGGRRMFISSSECLSELFGDPCQGTRKKLQIKYYVRGFRGCSRVDESQPSHLRTDILIGYVTDDSDPFNPIPRRPYRDICIERNMRLRLPSNALPQDGASPYSHLGAAFS